MPPSRLSVTILTSIVKDLKAGVTVKTICRRYHVSPQTVYRWRKNSVLKERVPSNACMTWKMKIVD